MQMYLEMWFMNPEKWHSAETILSYRLDQDRCVARESDLITFAPGHVILTLCVCCLVYNSTSMEIYNPAWPIQTGMMLTFIWPLLYSTITQHIYIYIVILTLLLKYLWGRNSSVGKSSTALAGDPGSNPYRGLTLVTSLNESGKDYQL